MVRIRFKDGSSIGGLPGTLKDYLWQKNENFIIYKHGTTTYYVHLNEIMEITESNE